MLNIQYECPCCGHQWEELYESACDSECGECGEGAITALSWTAATPEQAASVPPMQDWLVRRDVLEYVRLQARTEVEAKAAARELESSAWSRVIQDDAYSAGPLTGNGFILGLPIV